MSATAILSMRISEAARRVLEGWGRAPELRGHVPTIAWMGDSQGRRWDWAVGTYRREDIPAAGFVMVDGMEFVVEEPLRARLSGKLLDHDGNYFVVR